MGKQGQDWIVRAIRGPVSPPLLAAEGLCEVIISLAWSPHLLRHLHPVLLIKDCRRPAAHWASSVTAASSLSYLRQVLEDPFRNRQQCLREYMSISRVLHAGLTCSFDV